MSKYYGMDGKEIKFDAYCALMEDNDKRKVSYTRMLNGYIVSTFLICVNSGGPADNPLIFESIVTDRGGNIYDSKKYSTQKKAKAGHRQLMKEWREKY